MADSTQQQQRGAAQRPSRRGGFGSRAEAQQYEHEVLEIARVVRVVKGGRRFRFRACVVIGDRAGMVGVGIGKSRDVQQAIQKGYDQAVKNAVKLQMKNGTIAHSVVANYKGAMVMMRPARTGTGIIAGGTARMVADLAGFTDLVAKRFGSSNRLSNAQACLKALTSITK